MPPITSSVQLQSQLTADISDILNEVTEKVLDLLWQKIDEEVYSKNSPTFYHRTYEFLESWIYDKAEISANGISTVIREDPMLMVTHDPDHFIHGSNHSEEGDDIRTALAEIINKGKSGPYFDWTEPPHWWKRKRPFWDRFVEYFKDGTIDLMLREAFAEKGLKVI